MLKKLLIIISFSLGSLFSGCSDKDNIDPNKNPNLSSFWSLGSDFGQPLLNGEFNGNNRLEKAGIYKIIQFNNELYVGGNFEIIGGEVIPYIAKWNGSRWLKVGSIDESIISIHDNNPRVHDMIVFQNKLFIQFSSKKKQTLKDVYKLLSFDGNKLVTENIVIDGVNYDIIDDNFQNINYDDNFREKWTIHDNKLFLYVDPNNYREKGKLVWFDGTSWNTNNDFNSYHGFLTSFQGDLYATAQDTANEYSPSRTGLYRFDGDFDNPQSNDSWERLTGITLSDPEINTIVEYDNKLIIGGPFETIDGKQFSNTASFDGKSWSNFSEFGCPPIDYYVFNNNLYATFDNICSAFTKGRIAIYNNGTWQDYESNLNELIYIHNNLTLESYAGHLYLGANSGESNNYLIESFLKSKL